MSRQHIHDILVVGGGINGVGIARDAAGRGLDVLLCEQSDLASGTSSASTKLIHGGLRYLEHYDFKLDRYFSSEVQHSDIVSTFAGVRPLYEEAGKDASAVTRDYVLDLDSAPGAAPLLTIYGGKLTTYRKLAENALRQLQSALNIMTPAWTAHACLPGGDIPNADFDAFRQEMLKQYGWLQEPLMTRLLRAYGTRVERITGGVRNFSGLGRHFGLGLTEAELDYLSAVEFATTADDVLWRRSKLGLHLGIDEQLAVQNWFSANGDSACSGMDY